MNSIRKRLTYANVMSSLAIFLVLGGATAFAASQLGKNSVGSKQLKKNAVTAAKIKKNAVTGAKIKNGAVSAGKLSAGAVGASQLADGSVTGAKINAASTPFSRIVGSLRQNTVLPWTGGQIYPIGSYTQPVGEDDVYIPYVDVNFAPTCTAPRTAVAILMVNPANLGSPTPADFAGIAFIEEKAGGSVTQRAGFAPFPGGYGSLTQPSPMAATQRTFYVLFSSSSCASGSGVTAQGAGIDVLGTKAG